jgi:hypothetical protein
MSWAPDHPHGRRAIRDMWYQIARQRKAKGDLEGARQARLSARILDGNASVVTPRPKRPQEIQREQQRRDRRGAVPEVG